MAKRKMEKENKDNLWNVFNRIKENLKWLDPFTYVDIYVMPVVNPNKNKFIELIVNIFFAAFFAFSLYIILGFLLSTKIPAAIVYSYSMVPELSRGDFVLAKGTSANDLNAKTIYFDFEINNMPLGNYATSYCAFIEDPSFIKDCSYFLSLYVKGKIPLDSFETKYLIFKDGQRVDIERRGDIVIYYSDSLNKQIIHRAVVKIVAKDGVFILTKGDSYKNPIIDQDYQFYIKPISYYPIPADKIDGKVILKIPLIGYVKILIFDDLPNLIFGCKQDCYFP
ncbi:MAG: hypothetical protein N3D73_01110 [Candidatus Diapherotrites archaeon]|nr:hypothetical protein [Candidatus Diapherotrites archaeon]